MRKKKPTPATAPESAPASAPAPQAGKFELPAQMNIAQATELHAALKERLRGGAVVIDGSRVEQIDTAILQLLVSFWRTCEQRSIAAEWHEASAGLRSAANLIGVAEFLHLRTGA